MTIEEWKKNWTGLGIAIAYTTGLLLGVLMTLSLNQI